MPTMERNKNRSAFPRVDDHLVVPELTRDEVLGGRQIIAAPCDPPHADGHALLSSVMQVSSSPDYQSATDLLTRVNEGSNFATDTSIRKKGEDPETGARYLEELAFEVVNKQSLQDIEQRAAELWARGVRRIFALFVNKGQVGEWNAQSHRFEMLDLEGEIKDQALIRPVRVRALLDLAEGEKEIARALLEKRNEVLVERLALEHEEGARLARIQDMLDVLRERFGEVAPSLEQKLWALDGERLRGLLREALRVGRVEEFEHLLAGPHPG